MATSLFRGRGRGRGGRSVAEADPNLDPLLAHLAHVSTEPGTDGPLPFGAPPLPGSSSRSGDPTSGAQPATSKFKPRMVKRVAKVDVQDQKSPSEEFGRGGRGRGRGRGSDRGGRGRPEIVMTASGAFAMGPAEGGPRTGRFSQGPTRSGMRKIDNSAMPGADRSRVGTWFGGTLTPSGTLGGEELDLYSDIDSNASDPGDANQAESRMHRLRVADLNDISQEHAMAPVSLPWDPKRVAEREKLVRERSAKLSYLNQPKLKREQEPEDVKPDLTADFSKAVHPTVPSSSRSPASMALESKLKKDTLEKKDIEALEHGIKLKQEQMEELSKVGQQLLATTLDTNCHDDVNNDSGVSTSAYYIFQFPRSFPKFRVQNDSLPLPSEGPEQISTVGPLRKLIKKNKPGPDDWMGWGKGGRRTERLGLMPGEVEQDIQGQIGEMVIRRSGRVQMIIGDVAYDVLPAAQPTFHQEVAVIDPKPNDKMRAMFVLGNTNHKYIVAPDVSKLLELDRRARSTAKGVVSVVER